MTYVLGCSMSKWYWPTWVDWLRVYDKPIINLANKGYGVDIIYWQILKYLDKIKPEDHIIIMWPENHRVGFWYDREWAEQREVLGFFPNTNGKLWFSNTEQYQGFYRVHPELQPSFTHMAVNKLQAILQVQQILDKKNCTYQMTSTGNLWFDRRPVFKPSYKTTYQIYPTITREEIANVNKILEMEPVKKLVGLINWDKFVYTPADPYNPKSHIGLWEYFVANKEYFVLKHETDNHPNSLAHHDFALEWILGQNPTTGKHRKVAYQIATETQKYLVPEFTDTDFIIDPEVELLDSKYKTLLETL